MEWPLLTMTGIDARTSVDWIERICGRYRLQTGRPSLEFGILRSPQEGQLPRFPDRDAIRRIVNHVDARNLAFHLCGRYAHMVHSLEWPELCELVDFGAVGRVQVNSVETDEKAILTLQRFSIFIEKPVIMQWRDAAFPCAPGLHLLQDRSGGRGIVESQWASPDDLCRKDGTTRIGYAGGLGPANVRAANPEMTKAARGKPFWIDCESALRTGDWFDTVKAEAMAEAVCRAT